MPNVPLIDLIAGARPNFMKIASIIHALKEFNQDRERLAFRLIHTGQHYDKKMSGDFFEQLEIPEPHINLGAGSGTQATQTAAIMTRYEALLAESKSALCLVVGDVTSTMACSIVAQKAGVPVAHVEAGIRSGDWSMPEEINRLVTDAITNYFFTTSEIANANLLSSGVNSENIFFVGNTMIDSLLRNLDKIRPPKFWKTLNLEPNKYLLLTLHRPANVDEEKQLFDTLDAIAEGAQGLPVIFPVHPRTEKTLSDAYKMPDNMHLVEPQPYLEFIYLVKNSVGVVTDSGGITEETTVLKVPCMTLRDNTERPETISVGTNLLVGTNPLKIQSSLQQLLGGQWKKGDIPQKWDGKAGARIVKTLDQLMNRKGLGV
ncbi:MAG: UDP-N-acetylglucosamine 2-epimerase (non-hydrolyzing) [Pseudomonadales bacterium]|nr:UDP-N-acetylglucosamine 2-epimerase (non-hydrolyzing) [Pseudomonadales bacterium]